MSYRAALQRNRGPHSHGRVHGPVPPSALLGNEYFADNGATYSWYTNTFPAAVHDPITNKTWFTWEQPTGVGIQRGDYVRVFNHNTQTWSSIYLACITIATDDSHGVPSLVRDYQGYWHIFHGPHTSTLQHAVTANPDDPTAWNVRPTITPQNGVTYPNPYAVGNKLYVFLRGKLAADDLPLVLLPTASLNNGVETWGTPFTVADYGNISVWPSGQGAGSRWYQGAGFVRNSTEIHFVNTRGSVDGQEFRRDVHYLIYDTVTGNVLNFDRSVTTLAVNLPIVEPDLDNFYRIVTQPTASGGGNIPFLCFDASDNPHVLFSDGPLTGTNNQKLYHVAFVAGAWTTPYQLGTMNTRFSEYAISPVSGGGVVAYWTQRNANFLTDAGGDIWRAFRSAAGVWGSSELFRAVQDGLTYNEPQMVLNGTSQARMIFTQIHQSDAGSGAGGLKMFCVGDSDYLRAPS